MACEEARKGSVGIALTGVVANVEQQSASAIMKVPRCAECNSEAGIKPAIYIDKGAYFCIECCNYLDNQGRLSHT